MEATLLIVDDEPRIYQALRRSLHREPLELVYADCAQAALTILESRHVDVMLADENMPGMTGSELLSQVHQRWPDVVRMMLTGTARLEVVIAAVNQGRIAKFFTKPCNEAELIIAIRDALAEANDEPKSFASPSNGSAGTPIQINTPPVASPPPLSLDLMTLTARLPAANTNRGGDTVIDLDGDSEDVESELADVRSELDKLAE
ncbi:MAG: DNA-binding NtrC family response regulator [Pseudohongiellaceae bacterium]|jgi:DNA-binding NtrC family response regulator